ncbi:alkyl sulfatase C-terminal domain-containing protein [Streptomyces sp. NPDC005897]|uniref:alkyl sulfatase C-terminal domain-containing protein n=1 Tax=Streptomyces sp. NPDC005897 TaxID=3157081 RepID=UPI0033D8927A
MSCRYVSWTTDPRCITRNASVCAAGPRAWAIDLTIDWHIGAGHWHLRPANGLLTWTTGPKPAAGAGLTMTMTKAQLLRMLADQGIDGITMDGDASLLTRLMSVLDKPDATFPIVTP